MTTRPFLVNGFGERYLYDVNRGAFNQIGAANVFRHRFGEGLFAKDSLTIVIGTDSGLLLEYVQSQGVPEGSRFLFVELDDLLPSIEGEVDTASLDDTILLTGEQPLAELLQEIRFADYANLNAVRLFESIGAVDDFIGGYRTLVSTVNQQLDAILWTHNVQLSNPTFVRRQLQNLVEEHVPAQVLRDSFAGKTAVLLGGGPSLDDMLPWIRKHQNDLVVIAVSRICRRLRQADVTPHVVVSIDPTELSFDISKEFLDLDPRAILAHANHVAFPLLAQWRGRSVYLDRRYPWLCKKEESNVTSAGPTVTNTAFALALAMGFTRIIFAGIDMCHSRAGYSHAKGSNEFEAGPMIGLANMRVATNSGHEAETTPDFFNAIDAFGVQALAARKQGVEVINPAADAAVIRGVDHVPADRLSLQPLAADPFNILHAAMQGDAPAERCNNLNATRRELARAHGRMREIIKLADEALACNDGLFGRGGKQADFRYKRRMDKIEHRLDTRLSGFSEIVRMFSAQAFLHMPPSDREWTDDEIEQAGKTYYTAYRDNAKTLLDLVEDAQHRVETALSEESDSPDYARMLAQWAADATPGRAEVWRHRHPQLAADLDVETRRRFADMDREFRMLMAVHDTGHARKMRAEAALGPVRGKLQLLFKERNVDGLSRLTSQLANLEGVEAEQLHALGCGYLAEADGENDAAFQHYAALIDLTRAQIDDQDGDIVNPRLEDALRRMVVIALAEQWHDQALLLLETLAGMSPAYQPQFAELLRLSDNPEAAADVYTHYLSQAPGDLVSLLRLGRLYQSIGAQDAAKTAFTYILDQDPDNKAARSLLDEIEAAA